MSNIDDQNQTSTTSDTLSTTTPRENPLKVYSSYTPIISFQVTTLVKYNTMMQSQKYIASDWNTICQSGGVGPIKASVTGNDRKFFVRDLYIDDFEMFNIAGLNQQNRGSNATELNWTIIEPNGMDLIEELYDFCYALGEDNYCNLPYLIKIAFRGFKDDGSTEIVNGLEKYIPIHLLNMEIKVKSSGATYKVSAIPYNETGSMEAWGRVDSTIETWGATVADFCGFLTWSLNEHQKDYTKRDELGNIAQAYADQYEIIGLPLSNSSGNLIDIGSYLVVNPVWSKTIVPKDSKMGQPASTGNKTYINNIAANIAGNLSLGTLTTTEVQVKQPDGSNVTTTISTVSTNNGAATFSDKATVGGSLMGENAIRFNAGSNIDDCINAIIINSSYITTQISAFQNKIDNIRNIASTIPNANDDSSIKELIKQLRYPFQWFIITHKVEPLGMYDPIRHCNASKYTYYVQPYIIDNAKILSIPNSDPSSLRIVKEYDYILTGKNTEILNFDMDFKTSFITYAQSNGITKQQGSGAATPAKDQTSASSTQNTQSFLVGKDGPVNSAHLQLPAPNSAKNLGTAGDQSPERNMAADIAATIYAPAEMLTVSLTINGDPDYIKQDGLFLIPTSGSALTPYDKNRGILFNSGEIYINLTFKVPRDLNQSSGLLEPIDISDTTTYKRNIFSGDFRVLKVTTKINKGLFTQELEVVRVDDSHDFQIISAKPLTAAQQENLNYTNAAPPPASAPSLTKIEKQRTMGAALAAGLSSIGLL